MYTKGQCVVVVPVYRSWFEESELHSLHQCATVLSSHPRAVVAPKTLDLPPVLEETGFHLVERFDDEYFGGVEGYNRLLLSDAFYRRFSDFSYLLVHQLDAFVFKDELHRWCEKEYDYVGAPWFPGHNHTYSGGEPDAIGNGGLSLRSVAGALRILRKPRMLTRPWRLWKELNKQMGRAEAFWRVLVRVFDRNTQRFIRSYEANEDIFWGSIAPQLDPDFAVPTVDEALCFSFECDPEYWYKRNNENLPFGCHAWLKYDYEFWRPFIGFEPGSYTGSVSHSVEH